MIQRSSLRRALAISVALHAVAAVLAAWLIVPAHRAGTELVDIELAPPPPPPEALPAEVAPLRPPDLAERAPDRDPDRAPDRTAPAPAGDLAIDAGVDAPVDAAPDAHPDARLRPDARLDAALDAPIDAGASDAEPTVAARDQDGGLEPAGADATQLALGDAGDYSGAAVASAGDGGAPADASIALGDDAAADPGAPAVATGAAREAGATLGAGSASDAGASTGAAIATGAAGSDAARLGSDANATTHAGSDAARPPDGTGSAGDAAGSAAPLDTAALAAALSAGAVVGTRTEPAVDGAPTTAGTAANLLSYFPDGHVVTALIRFDRLRGTEWAAQTERLLRPLPDYRVLFGASDAAVADKLETLVISTPRPRDATATTLVARTLLGRRALRDLLGAGARVAWSAARGGLLGKRGAALPGDHRVFLSPFRGWFLLAQPSDLGALATAARGNLDTVEATGKLPPWLAGLRKIERETGDPRGPALVVTLGLDGQRLDLTGRDFGLGLGAVATPDRVSLAAELVPQGWLIRGNLRFASDADAGAFVASVQRVQQRFAGSRALQLLVGKPIVRVVANLAFARSGPRVSYATSLSIADARAILAVVALQLDQYFGPRP